MKFKEYDDKTFLVKRLKPDKVKDLNPNTLRMKTYKRVAYVKTDVPMEKRTYGNIPKYANGNPKVHFKDWLGIKGQKIHSDHSAESFGKADADGKWYGWSHRAIYGFGIGDVVKAKDIGNETGKDYTIKTDDQAKQAAIAFAKDVA